MKPNIDELIPLMDEPELNREQIVKVINAIWLFAESFADEAFGKHPVQQAQDVQNAKILQFPKKSLDSKKSTFNAQAANDNDFAEKGKKHA